MLLGKQEAIKDYFAKRINKILIPFIVWSTVYFFLKYYFIGGEIISFRTLYSPLLSPTYSHLWFFYTIIGLYLYIPILRILIQHSQKETLYYFIFLWFIAVSVIPLIENVTHLISSIDLKMISGYVGYLVIGYLLGNTQINNQQAKQSLLIAFVCLLITITGTFFLTARNNGEYVLYFHDYLSPNVILYSASTFVLLKYISQNALMSSGQKTILKTLSTASFGIYLIHPMVRGFLILVTRWKGFSISTFSSSPIYSVPIMAILVFGISFAIVILLKKIPFVRNCVP